MKPDAKLHAHLLYASSLSMRFVPRWFVFTTSCVFTLASFRFFFIVGLLTAVMA